MVQARRQRQVVRGQLLARQGGAPARIQPLLARRRQCMSLCGRLTGLLETSAVLLWDTAKLAHQLAIC